MTLTEFRSNPVLVGAFQSLLRGDGSEPTVLAQAIVAVQNELILQDAKPSDLREVSVRLLSKAVGRTDALSDLLLCGEPMPIPEEEEPPTFGVDPAQFQVK